MLILSILLVKAVRLMWFEIGRFDLFEWWKLNAFLRPKWEGGMYDGDENKRLDALRVAMELGADYIDVELQVLFLFHLMKARLYNVWTTKLRWNISYKGGAWVLRLYTWEEIQRNQGHCFISQLQTYSFNWGSQ